MSAYAKRFHLAGLACLACAMAGSVQAEGASAEDRLRDALRQVTLQLREAQDENAQLKAKQQELEQQLAKPQAPPADTAQLARVRGELAAKTSAMASLQQQLDDALKANADWQQARQQAVDLARKRDADATRYQGLYEQTDTSLHACVGRNAELYSLGNELLERYKDKGMWESLKDDEPFTSIHRVKLEKLAQDYHDKLVNDQVQPPKDDAK